MTTQDDKRLVTRAIDEVVNAGRLEAIEDFWSPEAAGGAREWITPFREAFPDVRMRVVELVAEGGTVVGHFRCSGTHRGEWLGLPPTNRRFEDVDEIYVFRVEHGKLVAAYGVEDNLTRLRQLGIGFAVEPA